MSSMVDTLLAADAPLFVTHHQADRDSLGSAIGLQALLGCGVVATPDSVKKNAQSLLRTFDVDPEVDPDVASYDLVIVLDCQSGDRIAPIAPTAPVVIDHHQPGDLVDRAAASLVDPEAGSTAELVAGLTEDDRLYLRPTAALSLLVGLLDDTDYLTDASPDTSETAARLFEALEHRAGELPGLLEEPPDHSERNARRLGVLRATGYRAGDLVFAVSHVGGQEGVVGRTLRDSGVDLALVCSEQSGHLRVVGRASEPFTDRINLGSTLLPALAREFGGDGGGHVGAGTATLERADLDDVESFVLEYLQQELGMTFGRIE